MSELDNCCGTTCDKTKLVAELQGNAVLAERIVELTRQNSELEHLARHRSESINGLMAQVDQQSNLLRIWQTWLGSGRDMCDDSGKRLWDNINSACSLTPVQCLAEVKAKAGRDGYLAGVADRSCEYMTPQEVEKGADDYANQLRSAAKDLK